MCVYIYSLPRWFISEVKLVKSLSRVWLFATPWTVAHQAPPSMGFSRQEYWSGLPFLSPGDLPNPGIEPRSPTLQVDALTSEPPGRLCVGLLQWWRICLKCRKHRRCRFDPWVGKILWRGKWQPAPVFFPGKILWTEEPSSLQSMEPKKSQTRLKWHSTHTHIYYICTHTNIHTHIYNVLHEINAREAVLVKLRYLITLNLFYFSFWNTYNFTKKYQE